MDTDRFSTAHPLRIERLTVPENRTFPSGPTTPTLPSLPDGTGGGAAPVNSPLVPAVAASDSPIRQHRIAVRAVIQHTVHCSDAGTQRAIAWSCVHTRSSGGFVVL